MERRDVVKSMLYLLGSTCTICNANASAQIWPGQVGSPNNDGSLPNKTPAPQNDYAGCQGLEIHSFAGSANSIPQNLVGSSGIPALDRTLQQEKHLLDRAFRVSPSFSFLKGANSGGAFATSQNYLNPNASGTVMFGLDLMKADWQDTGSAIAGIMGHEWAHIFQFAYLGRGIQNSRVYQRELQADFLASWYLVARGLDTGNVFNLKEFTNSLYAKGDFDFQNPNHHGTPVQRFEALLKGAQFGLTGAHQSTTIAQAFAYSRQIYGV